MPLTNVVLTRLLNNGSGTMVSWHRHISKCRLRPQSLVQSPFNISQPARHYSNAHSLQRTSFEHHPTPAGASRQVRLDVEKYGDIEKASQRLRIEASRGTMQGVSNAFALVDHLVRVLGKKPDLKVYAALILANTSPNGSVAEVVRLIRELRDEGFDLDSSTCHDIIKVLAVHPDYILRADILEYMRSKWINLSEVGHHDLVAGLLRDQQYEMALERLDQMREQGFNIQPWLYDLTIYTLADLGELDEAFKLLKQRIGEGDSNLSAYLWYYLLDKGSKALHYNLARYTWKRRVQTRYLNPSSGICLNMLNIAARQGDAQLAHDVFMFLEQQPGNTFNHAHYELLIEAYIASSNLSNALTIISVMQSVNVTPNESTMRPIYQYITKSAGRPSVAFAALRDLQTSGQPIPIAAMNCLIEGALHFEDLTLALDFYKSIHEMCATSKPNIETFNTLLRGCRLCGDRKDIALVLASEMVALKISPVALTYDRMVLICIRQKDDYEDGMRYLQEMKANRMMARYGTLLHVIRRLAVEADERVHEVLDEMENGFTYLGNVLRLRGWVKENWGNKSAMAGPIHHGGRAELVLRNIADGASTGDQSVRDDEDTPNDKTV